MHDPVKGLLLFSHSVQNVNPFRVAKWIIVLAFFLSAVLSLAVSFFPDAVARFVANSVESTVIQHGTIDDINRLNAMRRSTE